MSTSEDRAKAIIEAISQEAQHLWGEDWLAALVRAYCEIESAETGKLIKPIQRRSQIARIFSSGNTTLSTLVRLLQAVDGNLELVFMRKEIRRF